MSARRDDGRRVTLERVLRRTEWRGSDCDDNGNTRRRALGRSREKWRGTNRERRSRLRSWNDTRRAETWIPASSFYRSIFCLGREPMTPFRPVRPDVGGTVNRRALRSVRRTFGRPLRCRAMARQKSLDSVSAAKRKVHQLREHEQ